jgi:outer membrane protein TolC
VSNVLKRLWMTRGALTVAFVCGALLGIAPRAGAQMPEPVERLSFVQAVARAVARNPTAALAAAAVLRAEAILAETRSGSRVQVNGAVTTTTLNTGVSFEGITVTPRNSVTATLDVRVPVYAPARWALRAQALEDRGVADLSAEETRRQTALATADAYLTIIALRQVVDANRRARDTAQAHFDLATELLQQGTGSRVNQLRAEQELSTDVGLVESAALALYRAQEALGVLVVADGPVDALDEPAFEIPADAGQIDDAAPLLVNRRDLRLFSGRLQSAERVLRDSSKDRQPLIEAILQPQVTYPSPFFTTTGSWRLLFQASIPVFDSGLRSGQRLERQASVDAARATLAGAVTAARSEARAARQTVASAARTLDSARAAADQAQQVVNIVNISFRAGAATNIEVIDAERRARDADTAVAVAEHALRRARLGVLIALGRFP